MPDTPTLLAAATASPLNWHQFVVLLYVLAGVTVLMFCIRAVGLWLAATHPDTPLPSAKVEPQPAAPPPPAPPVLVSQPTPGIDSESLAVLTAAISVTVNAPFRITAVSEYHGPDASVETLMQLWSMEGRRQIYSSHKFR